MTVGVHELSRELVPEGLDGVLVPVSPALALMQVPLQQLPIGVQLLDQLRNAGLGLVQAYGDSFSARGCCCLCFLQEYNQVDMQGGRPVYGKLPCAVLQALMPRLANCTCCWPKTETTAAVHQVDQGIAHSAKTLLWWSVRCLD